MGKKEARLSGHFIGFHIHPLTEEIQSCTWYFCDFCLGPKFLLIPWQKNGISFPDSHPTAPGPKSLSPALRLHRRRIIPSPLSEDGSAHLRNEPKQLPEQLLSQEKSVQTRWWKVYSEPDKKSGWDHYESVFNIVNGYSGWGFVGRKRLCKNH